MLEAVRTFWKYNFWAQDQFFAVVSELTDEEFTRDLGDGNGSIRDKLGHVCAADDVWMRRIEGEVSPPFKLDFTDKFNYIERQKAVRHKYHALIDGLSEVDLLREISYKNLKGVEFTTPLVQILLHVSNHATCHRGQAASLIRRVKGKPPVTDMIEYFRAH